MKEKTDITRGVLGEKMNAYSKEAPSSVWDGVQSEIKEKGRGRRVIFILVAAAGIALAATVAISLFFGPDRTEMLSEQKSSELQNETPNLNDNVTQAETEKENKDIKEKNAPAHALQTSNEGRLDSKLEGLVIAEMEEMTLEEVKAGYQLAVLNQEEKVIQEEEETSIGDKKRENKPVPVDAEDDKNDVVVNEDSLLRLLHEPIDSLEKNDDAGNEEKDQGDEGRWSLGAGLGPSISYRDAASNNQVLNAAVNSSESPKMTYSGGLRISYHQNKRLSFESGVYYSQMGVNIGNNKLFSNILTEKNTEYSDGNLQLQGSLSNSMGTIVSAEEGIVVSNYRRPDDVVLNTPTGSGDMVENMVPVDGFTQSFDYLEIPFNIKYMILDKKLDITILGGLSTNFLVNNSITTNADGKSISIGEINNIRSFNYAGNAGIGFSYDFGGHLSLNLEPRFRYYLNSVNLSALPVTRPFSFGLYTGVNYSF